MEQEQLRTLAERMRKLRNNSQESNDSIGDYVGVRGRSVAGWMRAEHAPTYAHAKKVAELFEVSVDWLWRGKEEAEPENGLVIDRLARIEERLGELVSMIAPIVAAQAADAVVQETPAQRSQSAPAQASSARRRRAASGPDGSQ